MQKTSNNTTFLFILSLITLCHSSVIAITSTSQQSNLSISDISALSSLASSANINSSESNSSLFDFKSLEQLSKTINDILSGLNSTSVSSSQIPIFTTADTTPQNSLTPSTPSAADNSSNSNAVNSAQLITLYSSGPKNGISQQASQNNTYISAIYDRNSSVSQQNSINTESSPKPVDSKTNYISEATVSNSPNASQANPSPTDPLRNSTDTTNTTSTQSNEICNTNEDCALTYGQYVAAGLILTCNSNGVCDIS